MLKRNGTGSGLSRQQVSGEDRLQAGVEDGGGHFQTFSEALAMADQQGAIELYNSWLYCQVDISTSMSHQTASKEWPGYDCSSKE